MNMSSPSTVDLMILGSLFETSMSAYDLARLIETTQANKLVKISTPAIYKGCKRLFSEGLLTAKTKKLRGQAEKTIYTVTQSGKKRFVFLMTHFSSHIEPFFLDCNAFLYHIEKLDTKAGFQLLERFYGELSLLQTWMVHHERESIAQASFASRAIVKQYRMIIATLLTWCEETIREYKTVRSNK